MVVTRGWGGTEMGSHCLVGTDFLFGEMKRVLEIDGDGGLTTLWKCFCPRIVHLKMANFMLCIFYNNEKEVLLKKSWWLQVREEIVATARNWFWGSWSSPGVRRWWLEPGWWLQTSLRSQKIWRTGLRYGSEGTERTRQGCLPDSWRSDMGGQWSHFLRKETLNQSEGRL